VTVVGNEIRRRGQRPFQLTLIDAFTGKIEIDSWVEKDPHSTIIDYNTRYHGYTCMEIENMEGWGYYPLRHRLTKGLIKQQDILIGHDLTGDLKSLKMFHYKIIDTSDMFRSRDRKKQKLEDVVFQNLGLQFDAHDASNDAYACLFLVFDRLRQKFNIY
jgi:RNA exonuclease 1